jgi:hypothetical protein
MNNKYNNHVPDNFSTENQLVIASCSPNPDLSKMQKIIYEIENWETTGNKLLKKGVAPLFLDIIEQNPGLILGSQLQDGHLNKGVPREVVGKLKQVYFRTMTRSLVLYDVFKEIAEALNASRLKAVALKGIYLAEHLYQKIGLRQFSDIDLLFRKEDVPEVLKILKSLGFTDEEQPFDENVTNVFELAHLPHLVRRGVSIEVHTRLHDAFNEYDILENEMFDRAIPVKINQIPFHTLELHDMLIHLCVHLDKHIRTDHMQFYSLADIARLLHFHANEIDADTLLTRSKSYGADNVVLSIFHMVSTLSGVSISKFTNQSNQNPNTSFLVDRINDHLEGKSNPKTPKTKTHIKYINKIESRYGKIQYLVGVVFPSKKTLIKIYQIKNVRWYWVWYVYRWWQGIKGVFGKGSVR